MEGWDWARIIPVVFGSSLISSFLAIWLGKLKNTKHLRLEQIATERKEWRDRITKLVVNSRHAFDKKDRNLFKRIEAELVIKLNPKDRQDAKIIELAGEISDSWNVEKLEEFHQRISLLLKYDWDLTRQETSSTLKFRFLFVLLVGSLVLPYMYFEGDMGKEIGAQLMEIPPDYAIPGLALGVLTCWMMASYLSKKNSWLLSILFGNAVRGRYRKPRKKHKK